MAYTHSKYEVMMHPALPAPSAGGPTTAEFLGVQLAVTGKQAHWGPGFVPHIIKGAAVVIYQKHTGDVNIHVRFEADISTPGTATKLFDIVVPTGGNTGVAYYYRPTYYIKVKPGMEVVAAVTAAATLGSRGAVILYVEPRWEEPANVTTMATSVAAS